MIKEAQKLNDFSEVLKGITLKKNYCKMFAVSILEDYQ